MSAFKKKLGLYVHVPFCLKKCSYCNFYSLPKLNLIPNYIESLCAQIALQKRRFNLTNFEVDSIYFGGGTPSLLKPAQLDRILKAIYKVFNVKAGAEQSVECNPCSLNETFLKNLKLLQFNRLSIGVQSALNSELKLLGRLHSFDQAQQAFNFAVAAGFVNLSADLIIGLPGQTLKDLAHSVQAFSKLPLTHLSAYILKIEPNTPLFSAQREDLKSSDELAEFYEFVVSSLKSKGFVHYEISNFALPGLECKHNLKYWNIDDDYLGFGPGAHSKVCGQRFFIEPNLELYLAGNFKTENEPELISKNIEWLMLRTRLSRPVFFDELVDHNFNMADLKPKLNQLAQKALVSLTPSSFAMTTKGFLVQNALILFLTS